MLTSPLLHAQVQLHNDAYLEDATESLDPEQALARLQSGQGTPLQGGRFNLGNRDSRFWLYKRLSNTGAEDVIRLIDLGVPYRSHLQVYAVPVGQAFIPGAHLVLRTGEWEPFAERQSGDLVLHTPELALPAGGAVDILMDYRTRGATFMPVEVKAPDVFLQEQQTQALRSAFFYAASLILLLVFFIFGVALKNLLVFSYALLFSITLLFIAALEGYAYQYLWPGLPRWNQYASLFLMFFIAGSGFALACYAMAPRLRARWLLQLFALLAIVSLLLAALCAVLPFTAMVQVASMLVLAALLAQVVTVSSWLTESVKRNLVSFAAVLLVVPGVVVLMVLHQLGFDLPELLLTQSARVIFFVMAILTLGSQALHVLALRHDHDQALQEALLAAQRDAQLSRELYESRREYERVQRIADRWKQDYAATSHDIRQPLISMRAALSDEALHKDSPQWDNLVRSLDYLEALSSPSPEIHSDTGEVSITHSAGEEPYPADLVINTIARMFADEAREKSVTLRTVPCSYVLHTSPLVLMRILSNLVANAIKHAGGGDVLIGCRRAAPGLRFEVVDNGPGIEAKELQRLQQPYEKGDNSEGEGLGLAICWQLASQQGLELSVSSRPGRGTRFSLLLPAA